MVQQLDAYDFTRRFELGGDVDVAWRRFKAAAGMVVGDDDCRGAVGQRIGEDFARMNRAAVNQANRNDADVQDLVCAVDAWRRGNAPASGRRSAGRAAAGRPGFRSSRPPA